jgi:hypothetical protein
MVDLSVAMKVHWWAGLKVALLAVTMVVVMAGLKAGLRVALLAV